MYVFISLDILQFKRLIGAGKSFKCFNLIWSQSLHLFEKQ